MKYEDLEKLNNLREKGAITEEEYRREKEKILNSPSYDKPNELLGLDLNTYCMLIHLSQFLGFIIPLAGFAAPVVLWILNKDKYPEVSAHGTVVVNWLLSSLIYYGIFTILMIVLIGIPLLIALGILNVVFILIGAMKASTGIVWKYPFTIDFFKI